MDKQHDWIHVGKKLYVTQNHLSEILSEGRCQKTDRPIDEGATGEYLFLGSPNHCWQPPALPGVHEQEDGIVLLNEPLQGSHVLLHLVQQTLSNGVAGHGDAQHHTLTVLEVQMQTSLKLVSEPVSRILLSGCGLCMTLMAVFCAVCASNLQGNETHFAKQHTGYNGASKAEVVMTCVTDVNKVCKFWSGEVGGKIHRGVPDML